MTIPGSPSTELTTYIEDVSIHLQGVSGEERIEMLDDLREHLTEITSENPGVPLSELIPKPSVYAAELFIVGWH